MDPLTPSLDFFLIFKVKEELSSVVGSGSDSSQFIYAFLFICAAELGGGGAEGVWVGERRKGRRTARGYGGLEHASGSQGGQALPM